MIYSKNILKMGGINHGYDANEKKFYEKNIDIY